jgi:D-aminopeptidase
VKSGVGSATYCRSIEETLKELQIKSEQSLSQDLSKAHIKLSDLFKVEMIFKDHKHTERVSYFPDVKRTGDTSIYFERDDYYEVLRTIEWLVS